MIILTLQEHKANLITILKMFGNHCIANLKIYLIVLLSFVAIMLLVRNKTQTFSNNDILELLYSLPMYYFTAFVVFCVIWMGSLLFSPHFTKEIFIRCASEFKFPFLCILIALACIIIEIGSTILYDSYPLAAISVFSCGFTLVLLHIIGNVDSLLIKICWCIFCILFLLFVFIVIFRTDRFPLNIEITRRMAVKILLEIRIIVISSLITLIFGCFISFSVSYLVFNSTNHLVNAILSVLFFPFIFWTISGFKVFLYSFLTQSYLLCNSTNAARCALKCVKKSSFKIIFYSPLSFLPSFVIKISNSLYYILSYLIAWFSVKNKDESDTTQQSDFVLILYDILDVLSANTIHRAKDMQNNFRNYNFNFCTDDQLSTYPQSPHLITLDSIIYKNGFLDVTSAKVFFTFISLQCIPIFIGMFPDYCNEITKIFFSTPLINNAQIYSIFIIFFIFVYSNIIIFTVLKTFYRFEELRKDKYFMKSVNTLRRNIDSSAILISSNDIV